MIRPILASALALAAITPATAPAQTGYGAPSAQQYRAEQRATARLNEAADDGYDADDRGPPDPRGLPGDRYDGGYPGRDRYARAPLNPRAMQAWRAHAEACRRGDRVACERTGEMASRARLGPDAGAYAGQGAYNFRGAGRYDDPRDAYDPRAERYDPRDPRTRNDSDDDRWDDRSTQSRYDNRYARDRDEADDDMQDDGGN